MIFKNLVMLIDGRLVKRDICFSDKVLGISSDLGKGINMAGYFLLPGLRNAHTHVASRLAKGLGLGMGKFEYFSKIGFKIHDIRSDSDVYNASLLACYEFLKNGITHIDTMDVHPEPVLKALKKSGISYTFCFPLKDNYLEAGDVVKGFYETLRLHKKDNNVILGLANEYECSPKLLRDGFLFAKEHNLKIHLHLEETKGEVDYFKSLTGETPIKYLSKYFTKDTMIAHCTFIQKREISYLSNLNLLHCPTSNIAISSKIPPIKYILSKKVKVNLGTDSFVWNVSPSILSEAWKTHELTGISLLEAYYLTHEHFGVGSPASFSLINLNKLRPFRTLDQFLINLFHLESVDKIFVGGKEIVIPNLQKLEKKVNSFLKKLTNLND